MDSIEDKISSYAASLDYTDLTPEALRAVKRSFIDSIGCAVGALEAEPVRIARQVAVHMSSDRPATLFGTSIKTSPEMAAFVNGTMIRYLDFNDDYINNDGPHPSDNIAAILAVCESLHAGGKSLACGITLAYEIVDQLVDLARFKTGGWDYVTETAIGSALGVGKALNLSKQQMAQALRLAVAPNISLLQSRSGELSMWKACAGPNAARNGVFAAMLAHAGMAGPNQVFEGTFGLCNQVTGRFEIGALGGSGHPFKIEETFFKPRPVMYTALLSVETALALRKEIDIDNIESIRIILDGFSVASSRHPESWDPHTRETADHSKQYVVVAALLYGEISDETFTPERIRDPRILALLRKVSLEEDPDFTREFPKTFNCRIEVMGQSGQKWVRHLRNPKGHPANPMSDAEIEEKFMVLTQKAFTSKQARSTLELLWHLEDIDDVSRITRAIEV